MSRDLAESLEKGSLEQRSRRNWFLLLGTFLGSTIGLALAVLPKLQAGLDTLWPWANTEIALLGGLSALLVSFAYYLTRQQLELSKLRHRISKFHEDELQLVQESNRRLAVESVEVVRARKQLELLNSSLERRVGERSAAAEQQTEKLRIAKVALEQRNHRLAERYRTAHQFVDNVSHEFRTPLTVIKEYVSALREGLTGELNTEQLSALDIVLNRVNDLRIMVNDMLDVSRIEADILRMARGPYELLDIVRKVKPVLEQKASTTEVRLQLDIPPDLPLVYCDTEKISRIIINLGVNAFKFCRPGDEVRVAARYDKKLTEVVVSVSDTGPGIAQEHLKLIFERFRQATSDIRTSTKGVGLGLNIAKELVQLNFGRIWVESELDKGSTFFFSIPILEPISLMTRYLSQVEKFRTSTHVTLIEVRVERVLDANSLGACERFLQDELRRTDLLFHTEENCWLLVGTTNGQGPDDLIRRFEKAWAKSSRAMAQTQIPELRWSVCGNWSIAKDRCDFIQAFQVRYKECGTQEAPLIDARPS